MAPLVPGTKLREWYYVDDGVMAILRHLSSLPPHPLLSQEDRQRLRFIFMNSTSSGDHILSRMITLRHASSSPAFGRLYSVEGGSLQSLKKSWRKILLGPHSYEIDAKCCHATLMANLADNLEDTDSSCIWDFVENRDKWIECVKTCYRKDDDMELTDEECKQFLTSIYYESGPACQLADFKFVKMLSGSCFQTVTNAMEIKLLEPLLIRTLKSAVRVIRQTWMHAEHDVLFCGVSRDALKANIPDPTPMKLFSFLLQEVELKCTRILYEHCVNAKMDVRVLLHDGIVVTTRDCDAFELIQQNVSAAIFEQMKIRMKFAVKPQTIDNVLKSLIDELKTNALIVAQSTTTSVLLDPVMAESVTLCTSYANRDIYVENMFTIERALVECVQKQCSEIFSTPFEIPSTFSQFRSKFRVIDVFVHMFVLVWEEFERLMWKLQQHVRDECKKYVDEIKVFYESYSITNSEAAFKLATILTSLNTVSTEDDNYEDGKTVGAKRSRKPSTMTLKMLSSLVGELDVLAQRDGFSRSRNFIISVPDPSTIDLNTKFPSPRDPLLPHRPSMSKLFELSGLSHLVYRFFRMYSDGRMIELRLQPVYSFTLDPDNFVQISTETSLLTPQPVPIQVLRAFGCLTIPMREDGTHAKTQSTYLSFIDFCNFRADAMVSKIGPYPRTNEAGLLNTAKYPLYCHLLKERLCECLTHTVDKKVRCILDRLFCHVAGCRACHCYECSLDYNTSCHFCPRNIDHRMCGHYAYRGSNDLCTKLKSWYMFLLLYPHIPIKIAILLYSKTGGQGKSTLMSKLPSMLLGDDLACTDKSSSFIVAQFNSVLEGKRLLSVSEADFHFNVTLNQTLLSLIDIESLVIEPKFRESKQAQFYAGIMLASNNLRTFPTVKADSRKMMGFVSNAKEKIPNFEAEVLNPIYTLWAETSGVDRSNLVFEIMSYFSQLDTKREIKYFEDVRVHDYPLLRSLSKYTDDYRRLIELESEFLQPLSHYVREHSNGTRTKIFIQLSGYGEPKLPKEILTLCPTIDDFKDICNGLQTNFMFGRASDDSTIIAPQRNSITSDDNPFKLTFRPLTSRVKSTASLMIIHCHQDVTNAINKIHAMDNSSHMWHSLSAV